MLLEHAANLAEVFGVGVVGARLAASASELVEDHAAAEVGDVLLVVGAGVERIVGTRDIGREHLGVGEAAAQAELAVLAAGVHELCEDVLEEVRLHARGADAADLFLVDEQAARGALARSIALKHGHEARVGADAVVLAVGEDHAAVEAEVARATGRHEDELSREEVLLLDAVLLLDELQDASLDRFLLAVLERVVADEDVEVFALDDLGGVLLHLLLREVDQQVRHAEDRVAFCLADADFDDRAVLLDDDAVQCERQRDPLVLLDAAVVMRVEVGEAAVLVERVLLDIESARVDVRAEDGQALFQRLLADLEQHDALLHVDGIDLVAGLELLAGTQDILQVAVTGALCLAHGLSDALALRLARGEEIAVASGQFLERLFICLSVRGPDRRFLFFCHIQSFLSKYSLSYSAFS